MSENLDRIQKELEEDRYFRRLQRTIATGVVYGLLRVALLIALPLAVVGVFIFMRYLSET